MLSLTQARLKAQSDSKNSEEKKMQERNKNIVILIQKYLISAGYIETAQKLQQETTISMDKWDVADNMDLFIILTEFEQYYEIRYGKPPKIARKLAGGSEVDKKPNHLPNLSGKKSLHRQSSGSGNSSLSTHDSEDKSDSSYSKPPTGPSKKKTIIKATNQNKENRDQKETINQGGDSPIELAGNAIGKQGEKKPENPEDFFDNRVLKGLPDYSNNPELRELAASLQRDICIDNPNVRFENIVGLEEAKRLMKEAVILPLKYPQLFTGILEPWNGVLLYGPPGTGKTMLAKAVATECKTTFFNISASSIVSKWRGESEKLVRVLFELARHYQPSTIFIDEIDSLMSQRGEMGMEHEGSRRMKTELLIQMDGLIKTKERVFVLAASNLPWDLDIALLRRLEKRILVPLPEPEARQLMIESFLPEESTGDEFDYEQYAELTKNYSGSDLKLLAKEAAMKPLRRLLHELENQETVPKNRKSINTGQQMNPNTVKPGPVTSDDFLEALKKTKPSPVLHGDRYKKWDKEFGSV